MGRCGEPQVGRQLSAVSIPNHLYSDLLLSWMCSALRIHLTNVSPHLDEEFAVCLCGAVWGSALKLGIRCALRWYCLRGSKVLYVRGVKTCRGAGGGFDHCLKVKSLLLNLALPFNPLVLSSQPAVLISLRLHLFPGWLQSAVIPSVCQFNAACDLHLSLLKRCFADLWIPDLQQPDLQTLSSGHISS